MTTRGLITVQVKAKGKTTMRVMVAASIVTFGLTTTAHSELRYYIDQDVLRQSEALTQRGWCDQADNRRGKPDQIEEQH